jgi:hypothetical protein
MEIYTLDSLLRRQFVHDKFESLIWTERFKQYGDFQLDTFSTVENRSLFTPGTLLAMNNSRYVMQVESLEDDTDEDGRRMLSVKGRSLEAILYDRVAMGSLANLTTTPKWTITGLPAAVARKIFHDICVTGILNAGDVIPFIHEGSTIMPADTFPEPVDPITVDLDPKSVYDAISDICDVWNLGFRIIREADTSRIWFDIYTGSDRSASQSLLPAVVFTPELDNLQNIKELKSIDQAKNVAYVYSPAGFQMVYPVDVDPDVEGFERRVLTVVASDITSDNPDVAAALIQRGNEELAKARTIQSLDGEIAQTSQYKYGVHYNLGDVIEIRNTDGNTNNMRVTEHIFVQDAEGERSYPTLTLNVFINTGSWLSWLNKKMWAELGDEEWADLP